MVIFYLVKRFTSSVFLGNIVIVKYASRINWDLAILAVFRRFCLISTDLVLVLDVALSQCFVAFSIVLLFVLFFFGVNYIYFNSGIPLVYFRTLDLIPFSSQGAVYV